MTKSGVVSRTGEGVSVDLEYRDATDALVQVSIWGGEEAEKQAGQLLAEACLEAKSEHAHYVHATVESRHGSLWDILQRLQSEIGRSVGSVQTYRAGSTAMVDIEILESPREISAYPVEELEHWISR